MCGWGRHCTQCHAALQRFCLFSSVQLFLQEILADKEHLVLQSEATIRTQEETINTHTSTITTLRNTLTQVSSLKAQLEAQVQNLEVNLLCLFPLFLKDPHFLHAGIKQHFITFCGSFLPRLRSQNAAQHFTNVTVVCSKTLVERESQHARVSQTYILDNSCCQRH